MEKGAYKMLGIHNEGRRCRKRYKVDAMSVLEMMSCRTSECQMGIWTAAEEGRCRLDRDE